MHAAARVWMVLASVGSLLGCAALNTLNVEVASYGDWPGARKPSTYAFERLPSQQARADAQQRLEDAAHPALVAAGFVAAASDATPDVLVQVGARITRYESSPWDDPWWWHGGYGYGYRGYRGYGYGYGYGYWPGRPWFAPYPYYGTYYRSYDREVALLLRDRSNGAPLYEARARSGGTTSGGDEMLSAMFKAAMADFPQSGSVPHSVTVQLPP